MSARTGWRWGATATYLGVVVVISAWSQAAVWQREPAIAIAAFLVGLGFAVTAVLLFGQADQQPNALLFLALSVVWIADQSTLRPIGWLSAPGFFLAGYTQVLAPTVLLRYPRVSLDRASRRFAWYLAVVTAGFQIALLLTGRPEWSDDRARGPWPNLWENHHAFTQIQHLKFAWWAVSAPAFLYLVSRVWSRLGGLERRTLAPIQISAWFAAFAIGLSVVSIWLPGAAATLTILRGYAGVGIALAFVASAIQLRMAETAVVELAKGLSGQHGADTVRSALREALADPGLEILYWVPERETYVDSQGNQQELPADNDDRLVAQVKEPGGGSLAAVLADPGLRRHRGLVRAAVAVSGLALENARLQAGLRAQLLAAQQAHTRLLRSGLDERRQLERDLSDGAQQRLNAIGLRLGGIDTVSADPETAEAVRLARKELQLAQAELRDLSLGLYPAILSQAGLAPALESVIDRLPLTVRLTVPDRRWHPDVESAAYLIACESLSNTVKHAGRCVVDLVVAMEAKELAIRVQDDGCGFVCPHPETALMGLRDRISALGGGLAVISAPGQGTCIEARIPCG